MKTPSDKRHIAQIDKGPLKRVLGVFDLFAVGFGDLGSSIYYVLGVTAMFALGATPIALAIAGFIFVCTALSYAEMSSTFHESGGSASFARHAFNDFISFVAGWGLLLDYIVTIAISAFAIGPYLSNFFPELASDEAKIAFAVGIIGFLFLLNFFGIKQSTRVSFVLMLLTVITQLIIIVVGFVCATRFTEMISQMRIGEANTVWSPSWTDFMKGLAMAMVAYTGIESIAQLGAETRKPGKTVPQAIFLTIVVLAFMYMGLSFAGLSVLPPEILGSDFVQDPITGIVSKLPYGVEYLVSWVGILAAIVLFVAANAGLIGSSRLSFNMGEHYQLPKFFYAIHAKYRTPYASLAFFALAAAIIVALSKARLSFLADLYNFGAQIAFFSTHLSLIVMRIKKPDLRRPFKVPFNLRFGKYEIPITALFGCLATASVWLLVVITKPDGRYLGLIWIALGLIMYFAYRRKRDIPALAQVSIEKIKVPEFSPLAIRHILVPARSKTQVEAIQIACELAKLHGAKVTAVSIIEVPFSLPLDTRLLERTRAAMVVLKTIQAITQEMGVDSEIQIVRARRTSEAILDLLKEGPYDFLVLGSLEPVNKASHKGVETIAQEILEKAPCRIWICGSDHTHEGLLYGRKS